MEKKIELFKSRVFLGITDVDAYHPEYINGTLVRNDYRKYLRMTKIINVSLAEYCTNAIDITFEGYFDEEAIERDKKKAEEDKLIERITKAVLEKFEEKDKKIGNAYDLNIESKQTLNDVQKVVIESIKNLKESIDGTCKFLGI